MGGPVVSSTKNSKPETRFWDAATCKSLSMIRNVIIKIPFIGKHVNYCLSTQTSLAGFFLVSDKP